MENEYVKLKHDDEQFGELEQRSHTPYVNNRRSHLLGVLVYFPELRDLRSTEKSDSRYETLSGLLKAGDLEIIAGITNKEVNIAREKVFEKFVTDYPVGF